MKIRIERAGDDMLRIHRLYGEGVKVNEISRPQSDDLVSLLPFDRLEAYLRGDQSMIVDVADPNFAPARRRYAAAVPSSNDSEA
jgi:hypothetical protein